MLVQRGKVRSVPESAIERLPCSAARGADHLVLRSFFADADGRVLRPVHGAVGAESTQVFPVFLEMGAYDGFHSSNTWFLERCLGWSGVLLEPDPLQFARLLDNRPDALNIGAAICANHSRVALVGEQSKTHVMPVSEAASAHREQAGAGRPVKWQLEHRVVACGPLGDYLKLINLGRVDFWSLDVEGAEEVALDTLDFGRISIGVLLIEMRRPTRKSQIARHGRLRATLLDRGMSLAGQLVHSMPDRALRATPSLRGANLTTLALAGVVDEVWVNASHLRRFFPASAALQV